MNLLLNFCYRRQNRIHPGTVIIIIFWPHVSKPNSPRYKSALCQNFEKFGSCGYQDNCEFAHGRQVRNDDDDVDDDDGDDDDVDDDSVCRQIFLTFKLHPIIRPISIFPPNFHQSYPTCDVSASPPNPVFQELRLSGPNNRKTKRCNKYWSATGFCLYGIRCDYIHSEKEEQRKEKVEAKVKTSFESYIFTIKYFLKKWPT